MRKLLILVLLASSAISCSTKSTDKEATLATISDPEIMKYAIAGKTLYENNCANCHQSNGSGLGKLIPPLRDADYFKGNVHRTIWIIRHGQQGDITVNGQIYNQAMPPNPQLKPLEIAQTTTYLYNIWGNSEGVISSSEVEKYLKTAPDLN